MVNICEPVIKIVMRERAKVVVLWEIGSYQKVRGSERGFNGAASWTANPSVDSRYLTSHMLHERNVETPYISVGASAPASGRAARRADRCAGLGCRKKRTPRCNGADTGCSITGRESEPTSDGSFIARESDEPPAGENADGGRPQGVWCTLCLRRLERH